MASIPTEPARITLWLERRDDDHHFIFRITHPNLLFISIAVCLVLKPDGEIEFKCGFSVDTMSYAMARDMAHQEALVSCLLTQLRSGLPDGLRGAAQAEKLDARWAHIKARILAQVEQHRKDGVGVDRLSNIDPYGSGPDYYKVGIAAPTTRLGRAKIVGVKVDTDKPDVRRISKLPINTTPQTIHHFSDDKRLNVAYLTHETLKAHPQFSSTEKMQILQGRDSTYANLLPVFEPVARRENYCIPAAHNSPSISGRWFFQDSLFRKATYANGDSGTLHITRAETHNMYFQLRMKLPSLSSSIWIQMYDQTKPLTIERGTTHETRFFSVRQLDECLGIAIAFLLEIDPVWPAWILARFTAPFNPDHPLLKGHDVPPRHQSFVATLLVAPYEKAKKDAKRHEALRAKKAAALAAKTAEDDVFPDGTIFAFLKKGVQADQADLKREDIRRLSILMTDTTAKSKKRRRVLEPLSRDYTTKPFTPKNRLNFVPLRHADAVRFLSDYQMGWDSREQYEMAYRLSLKLSDDMPNPLLSDNGKIEMYSWKDDLNIRVTKVFPTDGYALLAVRIIRQPVKSHIPEAAAGFAFITTPQKEITVALPSTFEGDRLPADEQEILLNVVSATQTKDAEALKRKLRVAFAEGYLNPV